MRGTGIDKKTRLKVLERDSWDGCPCCIHCGRASHQGLHLHHVVRRSQGGQGTEENLVTLCYKCHSDLHSGDMELQEFCEDYLRSFYGNII